MLLLIKLFIALFLILWTAFGAWLVAIYAVLFGPHPDHRDESAGARSLGVAHIGAVWVGTFALALWFLFL